MRSRAFLLFWTIGLFSGLLSAAPTWALETVTVTVMGQSNDSKGEALKDAIRKAVQRVGQLHIATWSTASNYRIVQDAVETRTDGLVLSHKVTESRRSPNGVWTVKIEVEVNKGTLEATWNDVLHLMDQLGNPTIMLFFDDQRMAVGGKAPPGQPFPQNTVRNRLMKTLTDVGFRVRDRSRSEVLKKKNMMDARDDDRFELFKLENNIGADLFVEGVATAEGPRYLRRSELFKWKTTAWCKVYWSDSGDIAYVPNTQSSQKNYLDNSKSNAFKLLDITGKKLSKDLKDGLIDALARRAVEGALVTIKIDGVDFRRQSEIEDAINEIEHVGTPKILGRYDTSVEFEVKTKLLRQKLVRELMRKEFPGFKLSNPRSKGRVVTFKVEDKE